MCAAAGRRIVDMVWDDLTPQEILTPAAFDNAIRVHMAMGGSTNAIIHVVAMARRAGLPLDMQRFDEISRENPGARNVRPSGEFLMEDFFYAGGLRALMAELRDALDLSCLTVTGKSIGDNIGGAARSTSARSSMPSTIRLSSEGATAVLTGNLAPRGCVMKPSARRQEIAEAPRQGESPSRTTTRWRARSNATISRLRPIMYWCSRTAGRRRPRHAGMGHAADPEKTSEAGRRDMLRISDAPHERQPATAPASCTWRRKASSAGPWPSCRPATRSRSTCRAPHPPACERRGAGAPPRRLKQPARAIRAATARSTPSIIGQADEGCDFDFLGPLGAIPEPEIH